MKSFNIQIISDKPIKQEGELVYRGQITIGDFKESFIMPLDSWTIEEYKQQWREGLERIKTHNSSCLIATLSGLKRDYPFIILWALYKENDTIFIQNKLLFDEIFEQISQGLPPFNSKTCYLYLLPRKTTSSSGNKISEWKTNLNAINEFLEQNKH